MKPGSTRSDMVPTILLALAVFIALGRSYYFDGGGGNVYVEPTRRPFGFQIYSCTTLPSGVVGCTPASGYWVQMYVDGYVYDLGVADTAGYVESMVPLESGERVKLEIVPEEGGRYFEVEFTIPRIYPVDSTVTPIIVIHIIDGEEVRVDV